MTKRISVADAKTHLSNCIREAEAGHPVLITRHGKPVVAIVSAAELDHLGRLRAAGAAGGLSSLAGGWGGSDELAKLTSAVRGRGRGRRRRPRTG